MSLPQSSQPIQAATLVVALQALDKAWELVVGLGEVEKEKKGKCGGWRGEREIEEEEEIKRWRVERRMRERRRRKW